MQELRLLQEKDLESMYPIYVHYVKTSIAIFDLVPDSFDVFKEHMMEISKTNPFYVALNDDVLIGYGYVHPAFSKEAYKYCVELTIYFKEGKHYGLPSKMLDQLETDCRKLNMRWIISCITDSNEESIAFHKKHGFTMYGALPVSYTHLGRHLHYRRYNSFDCIKQKCAATGVRLLRWDTICFMKHYYKVRVPKNEYIQNIISSVDLKEDVVYSFLKRIEFNSGFKYYVVITLRGDAPKRIELSKDGGHRTGVDFGTSTIATASNNEVHLEELAPESAKYEKKIRHKQNLVDASMRKHNPENYNKNGTVKKGKHKWKTTRRCRRLKRQIRVLYRKQSAYIKTSHHTFINRVVQNTSEFILEPMNFKALQKKSKKTERKEEATAIKQKDGSLKMVRKYKRKKRYGYSIKNRSPGLMQADLKTKATQYGIPYYEIDIHQYRASQLHHDTGEYIKPTLSERFKTIEGCKVQRDLYSAFLICQDVYKRQGINTVLLPIEASNISAKPI